MLTKIALHTETFTATGSRPLLHNAALRLNIGLVAVTLDGETHVCPAERGGNAYVITGVEARCQRGRKWHKAKLVRFDTGEIEVRFGKSHRDDEKHRAFYVRFANA